MSLWLELAIIAACLAGNALCSGVETALYTVSRVQLDMEARAGRRAARMAQRLLQNDTTLVIALVLALNVCVELATFRANKVAEALGLPPSAIEVAATLVLVPLVFFFGDLLPKDLFRRRPYAGLTWTAPLVATVWVVLYPIAWVFAWISGQLMRLLRLEPRLLAQVRGREAVQSFLREGTRSGALLPHAEQMAHNVLKLRSIEIERAMVPWKKVEVLHATARQTDLYARVSASQQTRLPVVDARGQVLGYVHQLDVLGDGPDVPVLENLRDLIELPAHTPVDRALARLRSSGQRLAVVGTRQRPAGLLTLKDLVEEISGDLSGW